MVVPEPKNMTRSKCQSTDFVPKGKNSSGHTLKTEFWYFLRVVFKISDDYRMSPLLKNDIMCIRDGPLEK